MSSQRHRDPVINVKVQLATYVRGPGGDGNPLRYFEFVPEHDERSHDINEESDAK